MTGSKDNPRAVRTCFMSDFHMGYRGFDASAALDFLRAHDFQILYLLGDIIDGWKMDKRWYWTQDYTDIIDLLVEREKQGAKIFYTPGNHDEKMRDSLAIALRPYIRLRYGLRIDTTFDHVAMDGKKYLMLHGDQFDSRVIRNISQPADRVYDFLVDRKFLPPRTEMTIEKGKRKRWSIGKAIAKSGSGYLERRVKKEAVKRIKDDYNGIIFGHTHVATLENIDDKIIANCGSWTLKEDRATHHTAIIEREDGVLEQAEWPMMRHAKDHPRRESIPLSQIKAKYKETRQIIYLIHLHWRIRRPKIKIAA